MKGNDDDDDDNDISRATSTNDRHASGDTSSLPSHNTTTQQHNTNVNENRREIFPWKREREKSTWITINDRTHEMSDYSNLEYPLSARVRFCRARLRANKVISGISDSSYVSLARDHYDC